MDNVIRRLALVNRVTVTSQVSNVTLTGIDDDSVYVVTFNDVFIGGAQDFLYMRVTKSGTADTTSNYDNAGEPTEELEIMTSLQLIKLGG